MVVSLDKFTAVKMYDKVQRLWKEEIKEAARARSRRSKNEVEKNGLQKQLDYMRSVEMAVIVSEEAEEEKKFAKQKLDIKPHRERMNKLDEHGHDVEYNFKDPGDPLQLVFVCAMWLTGFDAPTLSTLYLDKPMKDHTLDADDRAGEPRDFVENQRRGEEERRDSSTTTTSSGTCGRR